MFSSEALSSWGWGRSPVREVDLSPTEATQCHPILDTMLSRGRGEGRSMARSARMCRWCECLICMAIAGLCPCRWVSSHVHATHRGHAIGEGAPSSPLCRTASLVDGSKPIRSPTHSVSRKAGVRVDQSVTRTTGNPSSSRSWAAKCCTTGTAPASKISHSRKSEWP